MKNLWRFADTYRIPFVGWLCFQIYWKLLAPRSLNRNRFR